MVTAPFARMFIFTLAGILSTAHAAEVSITMDDFNTNESTLLTPAERNTRILGTLDRHHAKAALFVVGQFVQSDDGKKLLLEWNSAGHLIGNHTFTHPRYGARTSFESFTQEILRCEDSLKGYTQFQKFFRFPTLAEGDTVEKRDQMRKWLSEHGYRNGHVTIDASDWYIDQRLREKLKADPHFDLSKYRDFYLQHIWRRAQYYDDLSQKVLGREVPHTLLIHYNLLNALFLSDLLDMFQSRQWKIIDAQTAFKDPVYGKTPNSMPSGQSLIWALAKEGGHYESELRYPGEDSTYEEAEMDKLGL